MAHVSLPYEPSQVKVYESLLADLQHHRQAAEDAGRSRQLQILMEAELQLAEHINDRGHPSPIGLFSSTNSAREIQDLMEQNAQIKARNAGRFEQLVAAELTQARSHHGKITGYHDAYGRILEEVDEFWDEVRAKKEKRNRENSLRELIQIATLAQRAAEDLGLVTS